uniref:SCP domain-containing protein n=1 Tax=Timema cristinae TaxID=61476 RepID=A0A7R9CD87_TIMCR|nr:unnamed protein product [Timema cristinae]
MLKIAVCLVAMLVYAHAQSDYCNGISNACGTVITRGMTQAQKDTLLATHNRDRNTVATGQEKRGKPGPQPSATNMRVMKWDDEIASIAQRWAEQCRFGHDQCRNTLGKMVVGQNVHMLFGPGASADNFQFETSVDAFYNEVQNYSNADINPYRPSDQGANQTGHYTQLVWANSYLLGCGYIKYRVGTTTYNYVVCNYGPSGNYKGQPLYQTGIVASACAGSSRDNVYAGLCTS